MTRRSPWPTRVFFLWLGLLALFSVGRVFYLLDYRKVMEAEPYSGAEIAGVLLSSLRFDGSVSAYLLLPLLLLVVLRAGTKTFKTYGITVFVVSWITVMVDHYFYLYFKDHFNVFFWEFFENPSNAALVVGGLGDVVPLGLSLSLVAAGCATAVWFVLRIARTEPTWMPPVFVWFVVFLLAARGTLDARPLSLQDRRIVYSRNSLLNLLHTNPFIPLYRGYKDRQVVEETQRSFEVSGEAAQRAFTHAAALVPGARHVVDPKGYHYFEQAIEPAWQTYLQRRPKHVVVLFMESFATWLTDDNESGFDQAMAGGFLSLKKQGLFFSRHFSPAGGTIKNIAAANLSFPVARDFYPSIVYHKEGYKAFPGRLPVVMHGLGYRPTFYYGGVVAWHRLYQFLPALGYSAVMGEHSFPELPHHENGLYDGGLFEAVAQGLVDAKEPTFSFVMTLTNHPPFEVPPEALEPKIVLPKALESKLLESRESFMRRLVAYRYADRSLKAFMEKMTSLGLTRDTLFVITGDHAFSSGVGFSSEDGWLMERIPLLFYGPDILKPEYVGQTRDPFTTHLDLMPSLAALTTERPITVQTFGKSVFSGGPNATGINHYFSCREGFCLKDGQVTRLGDDLRLRSTAISDTEKEQKTIQANERAYYDAAMHYLFRFQP